MVVKLDPEALKEFASRIFRKAPIFQPFLVEGIEVLIESARAEGVPRIQLSDDSYMYEPVGLQRFPEVSRRILRDPFTHFGDPTEFFPTHRIRLF